MTADDMDLSNLNIVAIPPSNGGAGAGRNGNKKNRVIKKKKNSKYERRRQRAQKSSTNNNNSTNDNNNNNGENVHGDKPNVHNNNNNKTTSLTTKKDVVPSFSKKAEPISNSIKKTKASSSSPKATANAVIVTPTTMVLSDKAATNTNNNNHNKDKPKDNKHRNGKQQQHFKENLNINNSDDNDKDNNNNIRNDEEEAQHAQYMANFHARPMELDRRSGAHKSTFVKATTISKESSHLFEDDDEDNEQDNDKDKKNNSNSNNSMNKKTPQDWESLQLHPRLVTSITKSLQLAKPTMIQSRVIRTVFGHHDDSSKKDDDDDNNQNNDDATITTTTLKTTTTTASNTTTKNSSPNILIQSETGSGKTLAYLLPILQQLGFDNNNNNNNNNNTKKPQSRKEFGTRCIILCPTRELANQTLQVCEKLCQLNFAGWLVPGGLLGGDSRNSEKSRLRKGVGIVVATPGRLLDHLHKTESLLLGMKGKVQWLVLDEADRLLDMGLGDQVKQIVQIIRANEATKLQKASSSPWWRSVLVSATVTPSVEALAKERMLCGDQNWIWIKGGAKKRNNNNNNNNNKEETNSTTTKMDKDNNKKGNNKEDGKEGSSNSVIIAQEDNDDNMFSESTPRQLAQFHLTMTAKLRLSTLVAFLAQRVHKQERTVVFFATCASVDYHYELFSAMESIWGDDDDDNKKNNDKPKKTNGIFGTKAKLFKLHGSVAHEKRHQTLKQFDETSSSSSSKSKSSTFTTKSAILLTTDVAARGLNLPGVDWTVQYDPPCEISDYVHRVGRVARAGKAGHSVLFLLPSERAYLDVLQTKGVSNIAPMPLAPILNQAAELCPKWTNAGVLHGGGGGGGGGSSKESFNKTKGNNNDNNNTFKKGSNRLGEYFSSELQRRFEECVVQDDQETKRLHKEKLQQQQQQQQQQKKRKRNGSGEGDNDNNNFFVPTSKKEGKLMEMARDAFLSSLRAYPTKKEAAVRSIFSARALHLGHVARSFALKEPPKALVSKQQKKQKGDAKILKDIETNKKPRSMEFSSSTKKLSLDDNNLVKHSFPDNNNHDGDDDHNNNSDDDDDGYNAMNHSKSSNNGTKKRIKVSSSSSFITKGGKTKKNAKALLLENAMKMQNNLMDAM